MQEVVNYSPYVYACRTGINSTIKTFHLFILVPTTQRKYISLLNRPELGIEGGFGFKMEAQEIHLQLGTRKATFGDRFLSGNQMFWATYMSFDYTEGNHIADTEEYAFNINIHKNRDGQADKTISIVYQDVEELEEADFYELKDGEVALSCPYVYIDQEKETSIPIVLTPEIQKIELTAESNTSSTGNQTVLQPSSIKTAASRQIVFVDNISVASTQKDNEAALFEITANQQEGDDQAYARTTPPRPRPRPRRRKMRIRGKKP